MKNSFFITLRWPLSRIPALRGTWASCPSRYRDVPPFFKHVKCLKNEAKQKPCCAGCTNAGRSRHPASRDTCTSLCVASAGRRRSGRFLLCVLTISPGESGRYLVAPVGRGPGAKRIKRKVRWTFLPLSGFAMEGEPRLSSKARTAKRRKVRVKKATDGLFQQPTYSTVGAALFGCVTDRPALRCHDPSYQGQ